MILRGRVLSLIGLVVGAIVLAAIALAGVGVWRVYQVKAIRCYSLTASVAQSEKRLLDGKTYACSSQECRLVLRFDRGHGLACYISSLSPRGDRLNRGARVNGAEFALYPVGDAGR